jgi:hypothetical protein
MDQPSGGGGAAVTKFFQGRPQGSWLQLQVTRDLIPSSDVQHQTDSNGTLQYFKTGGQPDLNRPKYVLIIKCTVLGSSDNSHTGIFPEGEASIWIKGITRDALVSAIATAGVPNADRALGRGKIGGAVITMISAGERPANRAGFSPTKLYNFQYQPNGREHVEDAAVPPTQLPPTTPGPAPSAPPPTALAPVAPPPFPTAAPASPPPPPAIAPSATMAPATPAPAAPAPPVSPSPVVDPATGMTWNGYAWEYPTQQPGVIPATPMAPAPPAAPTASAPPAVTAPAAYPPPPPAPPGAPAGYGAPPPPPVPPAPPAATPLDAERAATLAKLQGMAG